jgi:hypothetical protein
MDVIMLGPSILDLFITNLGGAGLVARKALV